jgi:hypothetical protein
VDGLFSGAQSSGKTDGGTTNRVIKAILQDMQFNGEGIDLAGLLSAAMKNFNPRAATLDETDMENQWNKRLKHRLASSEKRFREFHPPITGAIIICHDFAEPNAAPPTALTLAIQKYKAHSTAANG